MFVNSFENAVSLRISMKSLYLCEHISCCCDFVNIVKALFSFVEVIVFWKTLLRLLYVCEDSEGYDTFVNM